MGSTHHSFLGEWGKSQKWESARSRVYNKEDDLVVTENWLIGKKEGAENFALRYYEVQPNHSTRKEHHTHDHGIIVAQGQANAEVNGEVFSIKQGDVLYVAPNDEHVFRNTGDDIFAFFCIIPAKREKDGQIVWAEGDYFDKRSPD